MNKIHPIKNGQYWKKRTWNNYDEGDREGVSGGGAFSGFAGEHTKAETKTFRKVEQHIHIAEVYVGEKPQQLERTDSVGRSETAFLSVENLQSGTERLAHKGSDVNSQHEESTAVNPIIKEAVEVCSLRKKRWKRLARDKSICRHIGNFDDGLGKRAADGVTPPDPTRLDRPRKCYRVFKTF
ncbi:hypothetical protein ACOSQ2_022822 [Xanthoceras sorbifolium]